MLVDLPCFPLPGVVGPVVGLGQCGGSRFESCPAIDRWQGSDVGEEAFQHAMHVPRQIETQTFDGTVFYGLKFRYVR